ncbi:hypothetical protein Ancab_008009 [Ancistrocladus abbreviatus]
MRQDTNLKIQFGEIKAILNEEISRGLRQGSCFQIAWGNNGKIPGLSKHIFSNLLPDMASSMSDQETECHLFFTCPQILFLWTEKVGLRSHDTDPLVAEANAREIAVEMMDLGFEHGTIIGDSKIVIDCLNQK